MASLRELKFPSPAVVTRGSDKYPELSRQPLVSPCPPGTQSDSLGCPVEGLAQPGLWKNKRCPDEGLKCGAYTKPPSLGSWQEARPGDVLNNKFCDFTYLLELSAYDFESPMIMSSWLRSRRPICRG